MADKRILEVRGAEAAPPSVSLEVGTPLEPLSLGTEGAWRISGPRVLAVHGYLYFDGNALYVQSADTNEPLTVNRRRVTTAWTEVPIPSAIEVGGVDILYQADEPFEEGDPTVAAPIESLRDLSAAGLGTPGGMALGAGLAGAGLAAGGAGGGLAAGGFPGAPGLSFPGAPTSSPSLGTSPSPGLGLGGERPHGDATLASSSGSMRGAVVPPPDGESTLFRPIDNPPGRQPSALPTGLEGAANPFANVALGGAPPPIDEGAKNLGFIDRFKREWSSFSVPKRIAYILFPVALVSAYDLLQEPAAPPRKPRSAPSAKASASGAPSASVSASSTASTVPVPPASVPTVSSEPSTSSSTVPTGGDPKTAATTDAKHSIERQAAEAFGRGNFVKAAELYERLAAEHPDNKSFVEAARIARSDAIERGQK